jgi:hypothetical protein
MHSIELALANLGNLDKSGLSMSRTKDVVPNEKIGSLFTYLLEHSKGFIICE